jgi:hypothetical protein
MHNTTRQAEESILIESILQSKVDIVEVWFDGRRLLGSKSIHEAR